MNLYIYVPNSFFFQIYLFSNTADIRFRALQIIRVLMFLYLISSC